METKVDFRCSERERELMETAARVTGSDSLSSWLRTWATETARWQVRHALRTGESAAAPRDREPAGEEVPA